MNAPGGKQRSADSVPEQLGNFRLESTLGSGGTGTVYLATLVEAEDYAPAGARVALKVLHPDRMESQTVVRRFLREADLGRTLDHPAVVRTHDLGRTQCGDTLYYYLVMEYVEGRTLRALIRQLNTLPEALVRDLAVQVASALAAVHSAHATHRDLKPGNILITPDYQVKLMDLGVAFLTQETSRLTRTGYFVGTILYAAPEQVRGEPVGPASDLYSLGVVLYEAITGVQPFDASTAQGIIQRQLRHTPPKAGHLNPDLTPWIEEVIACLMAKDPRQRFVSAQALVETLELGEDSPWWIHRQRQTGDGDTRAEVPRITVAREAGFVGRFAELQTLRALLQDARGGQGRVLLIEGEAGVGKSRLLDELVRHREAEDEAFHLLYGSYAPERLGGSSGAITRAVVDFLGRADLEAKLAAYLVVTPRLVPGFVALLTGTPPPENAEPLSSDAIHSLFTYLASMLAAEQPLVWVVEDLHFATSDGRELLYALAREARDQSILLIATTRPGLPPEEVAELERLEHGRRMTLGRLSGQQVKRLLRSLLESTAADDVLEPLTLRSDGNPFFIVEMVRELKEREALRQGADGERLTLSEEITASLVPASVRDLLHARLKPLTPEEQALLDLAAVQGYNFDPDLLARVRGLKRLQVLEALAEIEHRTGTVRGTGTGYRFDHHQLREVVYEAIPALQRVEYHGALARVYEAREGLATVSPAAMRGEDAVFLTVHHLHGRQVAAGKRTVLRAIESLATRYRNQALLALIDLVLERLGEEDPNLRCRVRRRQAECFDLLGKRRLQRQAVEAAAQAAAAAGDAALARWVELDRCRLLLMSEAYPEAETALQALLAQAKAATDGRLEGYTLEILGTLYLHHGDLQRAHLVFHRQLELAESFDDRRFQAKAGCNLGFSLLCLAQYRQANEHFTDSLQVFESVNFLQGQARVLTFLGLCFRYLGEYGKARESLQRTLTISQEISFREGELLALGNLGELATEEGDLEAAEEFLQTFLHRSRSLRRRHHESYALQYLGDLERARGDRRQAETRYNEALVLQQGLGLSRAIANSTFALGRLFLEMGRKAEAIPLLTAARDLVEEYGLDLPGQLPEAYLALAGEIDPATVRLAETNPVHLQVESLLALFQATGERLQLEAARDLLQQMSRHRSGAAAAAFWDQSPVARDFRRLLRRELGDEPETEEVPAATEEGTTASGVASKS